MTPLSEPKAWADLSPFMQAYIEAALPWLQEMDADLGLITLHDEEGEFARITAVRDDWKRAALFLAAPATREALHEAVQLIGDLASELRSEIEGRYDGMLPQLQRRFDRDISTVEHAEASLPGLKSALGATQNLQPKDSKTEVSTGLTARREAFEAWYAANILELSSAHFPREKVRSAILRAKSASEGES